MRTGAKHAGNARAAVHEVSPPMRADPKKASSRSRMNAADLLGWSLVTVHSQHVEPGLDQTLCRLPVEVHFCMTAARRELEAVMRPAFRRAAPR